MKKLDFYQVFDEPEDFRRFKLREGIELQKEIDRVSFDVRDVFGYQEAWSEYRKK